MNQQLETIRAFGTESLEATARSFDVLAKGAQTIAAEAAQYARSSFEQGTAAIEKLAGVKTLDGVIDVQSDYLKSAYEGFVAQSARTRELLANLGTEAFKPYEGLLAKNAGGAKRVAAKAAPAAQVAA
ncbi:MAG TPA: phasin family protein [Microvirga sp.]|nr:phasin family protein [Microvirga sp.]